MRKIAAIFLGKIIFFLSRTLKLGGGFAASGLYALKLDPNLIADLSSQIPKQIIITGTNGKTTTSGILAHLLQSQGKKVIRNKTGSNLERGIASVLIRHSSIRGSINSDVAIWEIDEAAFNTLAPKLKPDLIVFLNAYRDQLDRYGEVDTIVKKWVNTISKLPDKAQILLNADDASLEPLYSKKVKTFSVKGLDIKSEKESTKNIKPDFYASEIKAKEHNLEFTFNKAKISLPMLGVYNIYNAAAALASKSLTDEITDSDFRSLESFKPAFGRYENFKIGETEGSIFLIKNPAGATQVLETVLPNIKSDDTLLFALNDNFADGRDVSWIWDVGFEDFKLRDTTKIYTSGVRAQDMALRVKYADFPIPIIESDLRLAFEKAMHSAKGKVYVLPTYTALLELQKILVEKGVKKEYWRE